jgi:glucose-1-phosphate cytidylyltransferase
MTGGRLKRVANYLDESEDFCFTYGDGVSDVNITKLIDFHKKSKKLATLTATRPPGRYGALNISDDSSVIEFQEKPDGDGAWINGGFFVLNPKVLSLIKDDNTSWEADPLTGLASDNELNAFIHNGFWHPMDTLRDKTYLNDLWNQDQAPWKVW